MHQLLDISSHMELWDTTLQIYKDSFAEDQREDTQNILQNIQNKHYKMFAYVENSEVLGFYILDTNRHLSYALITFLAVKESRRGEGVGSKLCVNAIEYFHSQAQWDWLFTEAAQHQAKLYEKLGFTTLTLEYNIPAFNSDKSIPMHLMLIHKKTLPPKLFTRIIEDIFIRGYSLTYGDKRLQEQLSKINNVILP